MAAFFFLASGTDAKSNLSACFHIEPAPTLKPNFYLLTVGHYPFVY